MAQRAKLKKLIIEFCNKKGNRTFSLKQLHAEYGNYENIGIGGQTPQATVRRLLQELARIGFIRFVNNSGYYTLLQIDLLEGEKEELKNLDLSKETPEKREYLMETYVRKAKWATAAKRILGEYCLVKKCVNTFLTSRDKPYIEIHHIIPLHKKGEQGIWNLSPLCAHHHRMAHFAKKDKKIELQEYLLKAVEIKLKEKKQWHSFI